MNNLSVYLPKLYEGVLETDELMNVENNLLETAENELTTARNNQYVMTCDINGIQRYETLLGIIVNESVEDLAFRRARIINRLSTKPPFTMPYLRQKLDELIGVGKWNAWVDNLTYTLYIESSAINQVWQNEIIITLNKVKPANIIYINKPYLSPSIAISDIISYNQTVFNYKLGTSWVLGAKAFRTFDDMGVIKTATNPSIQQQLLDELATHTLSNIDSVLINDTLSIPKTSFSINSVTDNIVTIEYTVPNESELGSITNIKILDVGSNVLDNSTVYVPLTEDAVIKHNITVKEGS